MPPIGFMVAMALAAIAVVLIIARYRTERQLRQSFQDLRSSQERRQLAQDRLDRSLDALGEFIEEATSWPSEMPPHPPLKAKSPVSAHAATAGSCADRHRLCG